MSRFSVLFRTVILVGYVSIPFALLGWFFFGLKGLQIGFGLSGLALLLIGGLSHKWIFWNWDLKTQDYPGLQLSLHAALIDWKGLLPELFVYPDPAPDILILRPFPGKGMIFVSQGLLSILTEGELRAVLKLSNEKNHQSGAVFQSFCRVLILFLELWVPRAWANQQVRQLKPHAALIALVFFPITRFFQKIGKLNQSIQLEATSSIAVIATRKVNQSIQILGSRNAPHLLSLF